MAYVPVPKDLTKVKTKVMFNLTKRQLICFTGGALIGVPLFFLLRKPTGNSVAAMCMMLVMLPFFMLAMYGKLAELDLLLKGGRRVDALVPAFAEALDLWHAIGRDRIRCRRYGADAPTC